MLSNLKIQGNQKVSAHLTITIPSSGAQILFDHSVYFKCSLRFSQKYC